MVICLSLLIQIQVAYRWELSQVCLGCECITRMKHVLLTVKCIYFTFTTLNLWAYPSQYGEHMICNPGVIGSNLRHGIISPWQLISDIESNGHLSLTAYSDIMLK
jgi:hypothetical protein